MFNSNNKCLDIINLYMKANIKEMKLLGGNTNYNYLITLDDNSRYILKFYRYSSYEKVLKEIRLLEVLNKANICVITPINKINGETTFVFNEMVGAMFSYVEGNHPIQSETVIYSIGKLLSRLHKVSSNISLNSGYQLNLTDVIQYKNEGYIKDKEISEFFDLAINISKKIPFSKLKKSIIHSDIFLDNIIEKSNGTVCLIDFEEAAYGDSLFDISRAIIGCCIKEKKIDLKLVKALCNGYSNAKIIKMVDYNNLYEYIIYAGLITTYWRYVEFNIKRNDTGKNEFYKNIMYPVIHHIKLGRDYFYQSIV